MGRIELDGGGKRVLRVRDGPREAGATETRGNPMPSSSRSLARNS